MSDQLLGDADAAGLRITLRIQRTCGPLFPPVKWVVRFLTTHMGRVMWFIKFSLTLYTSFDSYHSPWSRQAINYFH